MVGETPNLKSNLFDAQEGEPCNGRLARTSQKIDNTSTMNRQRLVSCVINVEYENNFVSPQFQLLEAW